MTARLLDGRQLAESLRDSAAARAKSLAARLGRPPCLTAILVGDDPASQVYVRTKQRACRGVGIDSRLSRLPAESSTRRVLETVRAANGDETVDGILVQLPLPSSVDARAVLDAVDPWKDVDAFHPENAGLMTQGRPRFLPCTPRGILELLKAHGQTLADKHVVVVGRSDIVGKPVALMAGQRSSPLGESMANATVTLCHSRTPHLANFTRLADILVAAVGQPHFITGSMVHPGAVVVDVGINRVDQRLVGDVEFHQVRQVASWITPVPGGVGPMTVAMLLENTLLAASLRTARTPATDEAKAAAL